MLATLPFSGRWHRRCSVCDGAVPSYSPLPQYYQQNLAAHIRLYGQDAAETCSWDEYSCPRCRATDRDRLCALFLREHFPRQPRERSLFVLDIAPSPPLSRYILTALASFGGRASYRTADVSGRNVDDEVDIQCMDLYPDESFDLILCSHVLEHVNDDKSAMRELFRVLRRGGRGVALVPINLHSASIDEESQSTTEEERWRRFGQGDHVRLYSSRVFTERLSAAGFKVVTLGKAHFGERAFARNGLTPTSTLYVIAK